MDLNSTSNCTLGDECATCGSDVDLDVAILEFNQIGGVGCVTLCTDCIDEGRLPRFSAAGAVEPVWRHCEHLGINPDEMAALLEREDAS